MWVIKWIYIFKYLSDNNDNIWIDKFLLIYCYW